MKKLLATFVVLGAIGGLVSSQAQATDGSSVGYVLKQTIPLFSSEYGQKKVGFGGPEPNERHWSGFKIRYAFFITDLGHPRSGRVRGNYYGNGCSKPPTAVGVWVDRGLLGRMITLIDIYREPACLHPHR